MGQQTPLYAAHQAAGAKIVDFGGWDMPLHYGSQLEEHHQVRREAGMFDVSHMTVVDLRGEQVTAFLRRLLANDVAKLKQRGKALYSCMLNDDGGIIDDLIVYYMDDQWYRMVVNAATRVKDLAWIEQQATLEQVQVTERTELAMIAAQGPQARAIVAGLLDEAGSSAVTALPIFVAAEVQSDFGELFIARTGYTGEDGVEIVVAAEHAEELWNALLAGGVKPCGLGARDTLRLEAGMNLYGQDMDETTSPLESGLAWTVAWEPQARAFIGRKPLEAQRGTSHARFIGLLLEGKGVMRGHQTVLVDGQQVGEITSGTYSPTLERSVAMARISAPKDTSRCEIQIRKNAVAASIIKPQFVRNGQSLLPE